MAVTKQDVRHVADLARLGLPEADLERYVAQLNGILAHMDALQRVPSPASAGDDTVATSMPLRTDEPGPIPLTIPPAAFAPSMRDGFFLVPRLATHEDAGEGA